VTRSRVAAAAVAAAGLLAACADGGAGSGDGPPVRVVRLSIEHSAFEPAALTFRKGDRVRFVVVNNDPIDHELIVGDAAVQARHEEGTEPHHGAVPGEVSVPAGTTRTTSYVFDRAGELVFGCHLPGHYDYGMRGTVLVRA